MRKTFSSMSFGAFSRAAMATFAIALTATTAAYAEDTIKIGALLIDSGPLAGLKEGQTKAINLAIDEINAAGGAAGKKLEADFITYPGHARHRRGRGDARRPEGRGDLHHRHGHVGRVSGPFRETAVAQRPDDGGLRPG